MLEPQLGMRTDEVVEWARYAERSGYGYVFRSDHLLPTSGERGIDSPECWVTLAMIAARTDKVRFGPMVSPIGWRNPAMLAKMANTIHSFSGGRLILGLGAGWYKDEYVANGFEFPDFHTRSEQLREGLSIVRSLTEGREASFSGRHYSAHTDALPGPKKGGKVHLIIGGKNAKVVAMVGEYADEWNLVNPTPEVFSRLRGGLGGRSSAGKLEFSQMGYAIIADNTRDLRARVNYYMRFMKMTDGADAGVKKLKSSGIIVGTADEFVEQVNQRREAGIQKFYFQILDTRDKRMLGLLTRTLKSGF